MSGIWPPDCSQLAKNAKNDNDVIILRHDVIIFFGGCFVSLVKSLVLELWQIYFIKDWPEIGNTPVWVLPNIWRWGELWITNLAQMFLIAYYWMLQYASGYSLYRFWVIKGKPTEEVKLPLPPTFHPDLG